MPMTRKGGATCLSLLVVLSFSFALNAQTPNTVPGAQVELRVITLNDDDFAKYTLEHPQAAEKGVPTRTVQFSDRAERDKLIESLQGLKSATFLQAPKITLCGSRKGTISCGQTMKFVTALEETTIKGMTVHVPKSESILEGLTATLSPTISADRKTVSLKLDMKCTTIDPIVPLQPVTHFITPIFEGGSQGTPVPFTQFIQKPNIDTLEYQMTVALPDRGTAIMYVGKQSVYTRSTTPRGLMDNIPYINRLFKNNAYSKESKHVILMATTHVIELPAADEYMEDYRTAVAEGRLEDAKRMAIKALEADPKCFAK
ncbi:MAG: hypothetical protein U0798_00010 [Gemmataceae bacterium]